ncbi:MAG: tRNA epoxyqueuosine(34) reductase QueG [Anaerolineae bacterium]|nr:tRNA epoxyqueuosine(34) reductase QueG [Anaerolineae bacterium]
MIDPTAVKETIKTEAKSLGFILCGFTDLEPPQSFPFFLTWLEQTQTGSMTYLQRTDTIAKRANPVLLMPQAKTIACLAYPCPALENQATTHSEISVAAYAKLPDYHSFLPNLVATLMEKVADSIDGNIGWKTFTDSAPILERDLARRAGLGWIGKNSMLISPKYGSNFLLLELFLDITLPPDPPFDADRCGKCRRCIDSCPTQAIQENRTLNPASCLSYLTIEHKGEIALDDRIEMGAHFFGCDICQQVCPWNHLEFEAILPAIIKPINAPSTYQEIANLLTLDQASINAHFIRTSFYRMKRSMVFRNACLILGNANQPAFIPILETVMRKEKDPVIVETAQWALQQLRSGE